MTRIHLPSGALSLAALLTVGWASMALPLALEAQGPAGGGDRVLATASVYGGGVDFAPEVRYREAVITVSGSGVTFRKVVEAGGDLSIDVFDLEGKLLPDGVYSWQLELVPNAKQAEQLRAAAAENGGLAPRRWQPVTGTFAVSGGLVVAPDNVESVPERRAATGPEPFAAESVIGPSGAREAAADDDGTSGPSREAEASLQAASAAARASAPAAILSERSEALERSDAAAQALGASPEALLAPVAAPAAPVEPRRAELGNNANGRDRSEEDNR